MASPVKPSVTAERWRHPHVLAQFLAHLCESRLPHQMAGQGSHLTSLSPHSLPGTWPPPCQ